MTLPHRDLQVVKAIALTLAVIIVTTVGGCAERAVPRASLAPMVVSGLPSKKALIPAGGELVEDLSIGLTDGAPEYTFGYVADVALGYGGDIFVADSQLGAVRQYDSNGRFIRNLGRQGNGPGEFVGGPAFLTTDREGRVLAADKATSGARAASRIHVYSRDGIFLKTWSFDHFIEAPITVDSAGTLYVRMAGAVPTHGQGPVNSVFIDTRAANSWDAGGIAYSYWTYLGLPPTSPGTVRIREDGARIDTIAAPVADDFLFYVSLPEIHELVRVYGAPRYTPFEWWAWSPLGDLLSGASTEYDIKVHGPSERADAPGIRLTGEVVQIALEPEEQDVIREGLERVESSARPVFGHHELPTAKPAYHSAFVTRQGDVWVGLHVPSVQESGRWYEPRAVFDVWKPTGEYVGRVEGPKGIRRIVVDGNGLVTWKSDELGIQRVVRYHVVWN